MKENNASKAGKNGSQEKSGIEMVDWRMGAEKHRIYRNNLMKVTVGKLTQKHRSVFLLSVVINVGLAKSVVESGTDAEHELRQKDEQCRHICELAVVYTGTVRFMVF